MNEEEIIEMIEMIEMIVPPQPSELIKMRLEEDLEFIKNCAGINRDLMG